MSVTESSPLTLCQETVYTYHSEKPCENGLTDSETLCKIGRESCPLVSGGLRNRVRSARKGSSTRRADSAERTRLGGSVPDAAGKSSRSARTEQAEIRDKSRRCAVSPADSPVTGKTSARKILRENRWYRGFFRPDRKAGAFFRLAPLREREERRYGKRRISDSFRL